MKKINKLKVITFTSLTTFLMNLQRAFAGLSIDTDAINKEFSPLQTSVLVLLSGFCISFSLFSLFQDYLASRMKDQEEREQTPFWKIFKANIMDLVLLGVGIVIIAAITIKI